LPQPLAAWGLGVVLFNPYGTRKVQAMRITIIASILLFISLSAPTQIGGLNASNTDQWSFERYPAVADFSGKPAAPILATPHEHLMRTQIRTQALNGPNFAGHFTVAKWGCGSPCLAFVIIDAKSGSVYDPDYDPGFSVGCADANGIDASIDFKLTSRLIVATGFSEKLGCGTDYYEWDGKKLNLIHFEPWTSKH
jgi:hypothetical protein